jgi:hypothetical protein
MKSKKAETKCCEELNPFQGSLADRAKNVSIDRCGSAAFAAV